MNLKDQTTEPGAVEQPNFKTAEEAAAWFAEQGASATAPEETPEAPSAETPVPKKPGAVANLFAGGALKEAQAKIESAEARATAAEAESAKALTALNDAAKQNQALREENDRLKASVPTQVATQTVDIIASQGQKEADLPAAESDGGQVYQTRAEALEAMSKIEGAKEKSAFIQTHRALLFPAGSNN